jgi:hypothetical protein
MNRREANANHEAALTDAPFINEYKLKFLLKRMAKTLLGGLILVKINSELHVPWYIYLLQVIVFLVPFLIGGVSILIRDLIGMSTSNFYIPIAAGLAYACLVLNLKLLSMLIVSCVYKSRSSSKQSKSSNRPSVSTDSKSSSTSSSTNSTLKLNKKRQLNRNSGHVNFYNEEQDYEFTGFCSMSTLLFIIPPPGVFYQRISTSADSNSTKLNFPKLLVYLLRILLDALLAGFLMYCAVCFLSVNYLQTLMPLGGAIVIFVLNWPVLLITLYSLTIREPREPAIYEPYDAYRVQHYTRAFYVICLYLVEMGYK